jgi:hypothetical protein
VKRFCIMSSCFQNIYFLFLFGLSFCILCKLFWINQKVYFIFLVSVLWWNFLNDGGPKKLYYKLNFSRSDYFINFYETGSVLLLKYWNELDLWNYTLASFFSFLRFFYTTHPILHYLLICKTRNTMNLYDRRIVMIKSTINQLYHQLIYW